MITLTTAEAAALVDVQPMTVHSWVRRGYLQPVREGAKPLRFREQDVIDCHVERMPKRWHEQVDTLAERWRLASV